MRARTPAARGEPAQERFWQERAGLGLAEVGLGGHGGNLAPALLAAKRNCEQTVIERADQCVWPEREVSRGTLSGDGQVVSAAAAEARRDDASRQASAAAASSPASASISPSRNQPAAQSGASASASRMSSAAGKWSPASNSICA